MAEAHLSDARLATGTFFGGAGDMPHYTVSKSGVICLTRVLAKQLGD